MFFRFDRTTWPRRLAVAYPASALDKGGTADPSAASGPRCVGLALSSCPRLDFRGATWAGLVLCCYCMETGQGGPGGWRAPEGRPAPTCPPPSPGPRGGEPLLQHRFSGSRERVVTSGLATRGRGCSASASELRAVAGNSWSVRSLKDLDRKNNRTEIMKGKLLSSGAYRGHGEF